MKISLTKHNISTTIAVFISLVMFVGGAMVYLRHVRVIELFVFVNDLVIFAERNRRLPTSIEEFCEWHRDANGRPVWDPVITSQKIRFLWLAEDFSAAHGNQYIAVLDPRLAKYEQPLNEQIVGRIPPNILMRATGAVAPE